LGWQAIDSKQPPVVIRCWGREADRGILGQVAVALTQRLGELRSHQVHAGSHLQGLGEHLIST
jgi:hypothetical protein